MNAKAVQNVNRTLARAVAITLALVVIVALVARSVAGLRLEMLKAKKHRWRWPGLTSRSPGYRASLERLRKCGPYDDCDPILVRELTLHVCRERARDAERIPERQELGAAFAFGALALAVALTTVIALSLV